MQNTGTKDTAIHISRYRIFKVITMKYTTAAVITAASIGQATAARGGVWCVEPGAKSSQEISKLQDTPGLSYRGQFKDFSIFVEDGAGTVPNCEVFAEHMHGDDGLWVVEEPTVEATQKTKADLQAAGQKIYYESSNGLSIIAGGGTLLPNITGLDGCGAAQDTAIIPVPSHSVRPPALSEAQQSKWGVPREQIRRSANSDIQATVDSVSKDALVKTVETLQSINSRNSYSDTLYTAEEFAVTTLEGLGFTVTYQKYAPLIAPNVIATWTPLGDASEYVVAGAHLDSRSEDSTSGTDRAPGAF